MFKRRIIRRTFRYLAMFGCCVLIAACGDIGMIASPTKTFQGKDTLALSHAPRDFFAGATEVGRSMQYDVSGIDRSENTIRFSKDAGLFVGVMVGKIQHADIALRLENGGRAVDITVLTMGNFDTGGQEAAIAIIDSFKTRLAQKFE